MKESSQKVRSLDDAAWVEGLRNTGLKLRQMVLESRIAKRREKLPGRRANLTNIWRIENEGRAASDIAGLTHSIIYAFFGTVSRVAYEAQLAEHLLRNAEPHKLLAAIACARTVLAKLTVVAERRLDVVDRLAITSLAAQVLLYQARKESSPVRLRSIYSEALDALLGHLGEIDRLTAGDLVAADPGLGVLVVRMMLNGLFAAYKIDELDGNERRPVTRVTAAKFMTADFARTAEKATLKFGDPRLGFFAAEAAIYLGKKFVAARLMRASMKVDGANDFRSWQPHWAPKKPGDDPNLSDLDL